MEGIPACFRDENAALEFLSALRWPSGASCPRCRGGQEVYKLQSKPESEHSLPAGAFKCGNCRRKFTVKTETIFQQSHVPLCKWLSAIDLMCSATGAVRALPLQRLLELKSYRSTWFMCRRIRWAVKQAGGSMPRDTERAVTLLLSVKPTAQMPRPGAHREKSAVADADEVYGKMSPTRR